MKMPDLYLLSSWKQKSLLSYNRWPWHVLFWMGYGLFRLWPYYITVTYYNKVYLQYMLFSELFFITIVYVTLWLYKRLFQIKKYLIYFITGGSSWILYLYGRTTFQLYYLRNENSFRGSNWMNIFLTNITFIIFGFLFITACKYFKDGYVAQQFDEEKKKLQLIAEVNNLKSQIAPHFLFNTLNNLYGLAVDKSDKLPDLMLRLSDLLRHTLYETPKQLVPLYDEIAVLKSYIELESIRLEDDLKLEFKNSISESSQYLIAPLILIVFIENAFKHAKLVQTGAVTICIEATLVNNWFSFIIKNNYNIERTASTNGIGLLNIKRRLEVLYPNEQHQLTINKCDAFYEVVLGLQLVKTPENSKL